MTPNLPETPHGATQADPAVEAAKRAWTARYPSAEGFTYSLEDNGVAALGAAAAREALKPIRELHARINGGTPTGEPADICGGCSSYWPCDTARLVYSAEELS